MKKKIILLAVVILIGIAGAAFIFTGKNPAPAVTFTSLTGEKISMAGLKGKVVLVNFWATSCPGCIEEMPKLVDTYKNYHSQGYETVAVAMNYDPPNYVLAYSHANNLPFVVSIDAQGNLSHAFGDVRLTPTSFLIDRQGNIIQRTIGELDMDQLHKTIEEQLKKSS